MLLLLLFSIRTFRVTLFLSSPISIVRSTVITTPKKDMSMSPHAHVRTVTVYVLEDLRLPSLIPSEPLMPIAVEEDEDAPFCVGGKEEEEMRKRKWVEMRPHRSLFGGKHFNVILLHFRIFVIYSKPNIGRKHQVIILKWYFKLISRDRLKWFILNMILSR